MRTNRTILFFGLGILLAASQAVFGQTATTIQDAFSGINLTATPPAEPIAMNATDMREVRLLSDAQLAVFFEALAVTPMLAAEALPRKGRSGTFYSLQHPEWPPLPSDIRGSAVWPMNDFYLLNDLDVDYTAKINFAPATPLKSGGTQMQMMMMSSLNSSVAYGNPVYLTNLVVTSWPMGAGFTIAGGTNNVPYDILMTTNLLSEWNWLGIGYTSNRYDFTNQPADTAFYKLAKPSKTMTVAWGDDTYGQTDLPSNLTNAVAVSAGFEFSLALLNNGTVVGWGFNGASSSDLVPANLVGVAMIASGWQHNVAVRTNGAVTAWGDNFYNQINVPAGLTNVMVVSAQGLHSLALKTNGTVVAWGYESGYGNTSVPAGLTNVTAIAAGIWHNLAVSNGYVVAWGYNGSNQTTVPTDLSNVVDVAAGFTHSVALKKDGTVVCWGGNGDGEATVPSGLSNVVAIAAGGKVQPISGFTLAVTKEGRLFVWGNKTVSAQLNGADNVIAVGAGAFHGLAVRTGPPTPVVTLEPTDKYQFAGSTVSFTAKGAGLYGVTYQWQTNSVNLPGATNATLNLTNVQLAQQGSYRAVVTDNGGYGNIASSNASLTIVTPPVFVYQSQPTNIVTIYGKLLAFSGTAVAPGMTNGFPISYRWRFNGTNLSGTTTNYSLTINETNGGTYSLVASNAAGTASVSWQVTVTNAIDVTQDLLLIYNTNSVDSTTVLNYYLAHRPGVSGANVLGIGCTTNETFLPSEYTNVFAAQVQSWLAANPTKRPQYVVLFPDIPSRVNTNNTPWVYYDSGAKASVQVQLATGCATGWNPFVTAINMNGLDGTNDCIGYINKLAALGTNNAPGSPLLSASANGYANTNWYFDDAASIYHAQKGFEALQGVMSNGVPSAAIHYASYTSPHIYSGTNVAGFYTDGNDSGMWTNYCLFPTYEGTNVLYPEVVFHGNSGWYLMEAIDSLDGHRAFSGANFVGWYSAAAFGGTNYSNTPIGAVCTVDEPSLYGKNNTFVYFGLWSSGKNFAVCAWTSRQTPYFQAVGDPFVTK